MASGEGHAALAGNSTPAFRAATAVSDKPSGFSALAGRGPNGFAHAKLRIVPLPVRTPNAPYLGMFENVCPRIDLRRWNQAARPNRVVYAVGLALFLNLFAANGSRVEAGSKSNTGEGFSLSASMGPQSFSIQQTTSNVLAAGGYVIRVGNSRLVASTQISSRDVILGSRSEVWHAIAVKQVTFAATAQIKGPPVASP